MLIGERFNGPRRERWDELCKSDPGGWLELAVRLGAFHDARSRSRLASIGITFNVPTWAIGSVQGEESSSCTLSSPTVDRTMNLLPPAPQKVRWAPTLAGQVAIAWYPHLLDYEVTYLCGRKVASAFGVPVSGPIPSRWGLSSADWGDCFLLQDDEECDHTLVVLPHPSGLNRFWNDEIAVELAREMLS
jgi:hypothetical protein